MSRILRGPWIRVAALSAAVAVWPVIALAQQAASASSSTAKVDINSATTKQLETLPGVTAATAKKIVAGRPYAAVGDLSKAGVSAKVIADITPQIVVGPAQTGSTNPPAKPTKAKGPTPASSPTTASPLDLNTASQADLQTLPDISAASAKKIIAARPYTSVSDLSKAGLSAKAISSITPLVTVKAPPAGAPAAAAPATTAPATSAPASTAKTAAKTTPQVPPEKGMVWVNLSTKVYHKEGDSCYGNTKNGKFMAEADAEKAGYRLSKTTTGCGGGDF